MKVLFVITARGGSKGVPRKNIKPIGGLPLIAYKIIAAQQAKLKKRIIVSTDDEEIADVARKYGAEVPFLRPDYLASDEASSIDVVLHAMNWISENDTTDYDYVCLLEPSSPFTKASDLDKAVELIHNKGADTLLGMKEVEITRSFINILDDNGGLSYFYDEMQNIKSARRQDQAKEYTMNGCMYISKWDYFMENHSFHSKNSLPYIMPEVQSVEIDNMINYYYACYLVEKGIIDLSEWKI